MTGVKRATVLTLGICLLAGQANAQFVASARDKASGAWGMAWGQPNENSARSEAIANCGSPGCELVRTYLAKCIAVATSSTSKAWGFGYGDEARAHNNALNLCGATCKVQQVRCGR